MPANTTHGYPYPLPTEPVSEGAQAIRNLAEAIDTRQAGYGTTLPASPVDGQEFVLVDALPTPIYSWKLRYNAGSSSANKWEYIGGAPWYAMAYAGTDQQFTGNNTWVAASPALNAPRAGDYLVRFGASFKGTVPGIIITLNVGNAGAPAGTALAFHLDTASANAIHRVTLEERVTGFAANAVIQPLIMANANQPYVRDLALLIEPVRLA